MIFSDDEIKRASRDSSCLDAGVFFSSQSIIQTFRKKLLNFNIEFRSSVSSSIRLFAFR